MPQQTVNAGEVIRAQFFNDLLQRVNDLESRLGSTGVTGSLVPNVVGRTLADARALLTQPTVNLSIGNAFDAFGTVIDATLTSVANRLVLNQVPPPGMRAQAGSFVDLVLAGVATGSSAPSTPTPIVRIDSFDKNSVPMLQPITINGFGFSTNAAENHVYFDNVLAPPPDQNGASFLVVRVPTLTNPPPTTGRLVPVRVEVRGVTGTSQLTVLPALSGAEVHITGLDVSPATSVKVGNDIKINGSGFSNVAAENVVFFNTDPRAASAVTGSTQLTVRVPPITGLPPAQVVFVTVKVGTGANIKSSVETLTPFVNP